MQSLTFFHLTLSTFFNQGITPLYNYYITSSCIYTNMYNYIQSMERNIYLHACDYFYDNHNLEIKLCTSSGIALP